MNTVVVIKNHIKNRGVFLTLLAIFIASIIQISNPIQSSAAGTAQWINRYYIKYDNQLYKDSNTFDNTYEYVQQNTALGTCPNKITFDKKNDIGTTTNFFYNDDRYSSDFEPKFHPGQSGRDSQGNYCIHGSSENINISDTFNRKVTFYQNDDKITSLYTSSVTFSRHESFKNVDRFFKTDEISSSSAICPDMILLHKADPVNKAYSPFPNNDVDRSAILFAVHSSSSGDASESYAIASELHNVNEDSCRTADPEITGPNGEFGIASSNGAQYMRAAGLNSNGDSADGDGDYKDDAYIIFIGTTANLPTGADGSTASAPNDNTTTSSTEDTAGTCKGGALGWIVCPIANAIADFFGGVQSFIGSLLNINPLSLDENDGIYQAWRNFQNIANVMFILAFFAIIFSQATSIGISNYGIKRLLPRLVAVAVATNLSYYLCSFAIDIFNVLGSGILNLMDDAVQSTGQTSGVNTLAAGALDLTLLTGFIVAAIKTGFIVHITPIILGALLAVLLTLFVIIARHAIVVALVIISPVAIVASLLPGTEKWFKKWLDALIGLLIMYPLLMGMFGASNVASRIFNIEGDETSLEGTLKKAVSIILQIAVLFSAIYLFKLSFVTKSALGSIAKFASNLQNRGQQAYKGSMAHQKRLAAYQEHKREQFTRRANMPFDRRNLQSYRGALYRGMNRALPTEAREKMAIELANAQQAAEERTVSTLNKSLSHNYGSDGNALAIASRMTQRDLRNTEGYRQRLMDEEGRRLVAQGITQNSTRYNAMMANHDAAINTALEIGSSTEYKNQVGSSAFQIAALQNAQAGAGSVSNVENATRDLALALNDKYKSTSKVNALLNNNISSGARQSGYSSLIYAGLTSDGQFATGGMRGETGSFKVKGNNIEAAGAVGNASIEKINPGQIYNENNELTDFGKALALVLTQSPASGAKRLASAMQTNTKEATRNELRQLAEQISSGGVEIKQTNKTGDVISKRVEQADFKSGVETIQAGGIYAPNQAQQ